MRVIILFLIFITCSQATAQVLHHEMVSSQGGAVVTPVGYKVNYTIGQSVTGTASNGFTVQQGFQQSNWGSIIKKNNNTIITTAFPNPFVETISFAFSSSPGETINVVVYDILGRLIHSVTLPNESNKIKLNLSWIPSAEYLVKLTSGDYEYSTQIIKNG